MHCIYIYITWCENVSKGSYARYVCRYILDSGKASIKIKHGFQLVFCGSVRNLELKSTISLAANGFVFGNGLNSQADMHAISIYKGKNLGGKDIPIKAFTSYWFMYKIPCHVVIPGRANWHNCCTGCSSSSSTRRCNANGRPFYLGFFFGYFLCRCPCCIYIYRTRRHLVNLVTLTVGLNKEKLQPSIHNQQHSFNMMFHTIAIRTQNSRNQTS